jgi:hypothetical protein
MNNEFKPCLCGDIACMRCYPYQVYLEDEEDQGEVPISQQEQWEQDYEADQ